MAALKITSGNELTLDTGRGECFAIHPLWLRERCRDAGSIDLHTGQRLYDPSDLPLDLQLAAVSETSPGRYRVAFSDGHEAEFAGEDILHEYSLAPGDHDCPAPQLWDATLRTLPRAKWPAGGAVEPRPEWIEAFLQLGFIILEGVPTAPGSVLEAAATFGFVRATNFGALFDVRSVPDATDLAYTPVPLDAHTDNPYRDPVPGIQLLHCLVNETSGGLSTLVDGFAVAAHLKATDPDAFHILAHTPVRYRYRDAATELVASAVPIDLDVTGRLRSVHFSPRLDFVPLRAPAQLRAYYRARRTFDQLLRSPQFEIRFLLNAGDLVMFDNRRLLHGRTGFDPAEGVRHLQGCYIDIDALRSWHRVLRRRSQAHAGRQA
jgi:gamma-butyrobetaine dioxygenase